MTVRVQVDADTRRHVPVRTLRELGRRITRAAQRLGIDRDAMETIAVRIVSDERMKRLHAQFLGEDKPTDVLSFPSEDEASLGDLVLDWDAVTRQAGPTDAERLEEAVSLGVHGLAHLLGHDHGSRTQARAMLRVERKAARAAGLAAVNRPYGGGR